MLWGEDLQGAGLPSYYLLDLATGRRQTLRNRFTVAGASILNAVFQRGLLCTGGTWNQSHCNDSGVLETNLSSGATHPIALAANCMRNSRGGSPPELTRSRRPLPLRLSGETVTAWSLLSGHLLYLGVTRAPFGLIAPSTLIVLDLRTGAIRDLVTSPGVIASVAADGQLVAFTAGNAQASYSGVYAYNESDSCLTVLGAGYFPSVSGPLVTYWGDGTLGGEVYDSRTDARYVLPPDARLPMLLGTKVSWYQNNTHTLYAPVHRSQLN